MDTLAAFLEGPRARGAFLLRSVMDPPWSLRIADRAPLTIVAVVAGQAWIVPEGDDAQQLDAGDIAIVRGPAPYTVAHHPDEPPTIMILPDQQCADMHGNRLDASMYLGVRAWGNAALGATTMLTGTYTTDGEVSRRLLQALPNLIVLRADQWRSPLVAFLTDEVAKDDPGQDVVLDRLLDLLLIGALRAWFSRPDVTTPAWYRAHADPVVGRALRLLHEDPARSWTVGTLGAEVGISRAALARRFNELVGEPPMSYLAGWRLALAADLLREPDAAVTAVARQVGYLSPFTFSAAFKRVHGISPKEYRDTSHVA